MGTLLMYLGMFWLGGLCGIVAMACCAVASERYGRRRTGR